MSFVGILTTAKNEHYLKHLLKEASSNHHIFYLHEDNINNVKNITFETILIGKTVDIQKEKTRHLIQKSNYLIFNADRKENVPILQNLNLNFITYGLGSKCTITASSIEEDQMMICLQRGVQTPTGEVIEPQEFAFTREEEQDSYTIMEFAALSFLYPDLVNK